MVCHRVGDQHEPVVLHPQAGVRVDRHQATELSRAVDCKHPRLVGVVALVLAAYLLTLAGDGRAAGA